MKTPRVRRPGRAGLLTRRGGIDARAPELDPLRRVGRFGDLTATNGEQALQKVREEKPDLVILDIMMPKLDGYETCRMIKSDPATKNIPVILLTAKGREVDQKLGREVGANDYMTKPFSPSKLIERVQAILGVRR